jgi:WD40 repeat protein
MTRNGSIRVAAHESIADAVLFSGGKRVVTLGVNYSVRVFDTQSGRELVTLREPSESAPSEFGRFQRNLRDDRWSFTAISELAVSPDDSYIAAKGPNGVAVWKAKIFPNTIAN